MSAQTHAISSAAASVVRDMDEATYHADPIAGGSLSYSGAKLLLESPARYKWAQDHRTESAAFDQGHAVHTLALGTGVDIEVVDADDWRTKAAREQRDAAHEAGRAPLLAREYAQAQAMADALLAHEVAGPLFAAPGISEASVFAADEPTGVMLRARPDRISHAAIIDVKTAQSANPADFQRAAARFAYDVQSVWYRHLVAESMGESLPFLFAVVETVEPYLVSVIELDAEFDAIGRQRMRRAIDTFKRCRDADEWPGYEPRVHLLDPPRWLAYDEGVAF